MRRAIRYDREAWAYGEDSQSRTAEIDSEEERKKRARRNLSDSDGRIIWGDTSFISTEEIAWRYRKSSAMISRKTLS